MVAAHEIGHTLGLEHSPVRHALMSPYYRKLGRSLVLSWDDIIAVQQLYGRLHTCTSIFVRTFIHIIDCPAPNPNLDPKLNVKTNVPTLICSAWTVKHGYELY